MRAAALALSLTLVPAAAWASPPDLFGYGARSSAMAGAGASFVSDYSAVYANPAGLGHLRERAFTLGFAGASFALELGEGRVPADTGFGTTIGLSLPLPFGGALRDRVGVGLGFFTPTNVVVRGRILRPETPQFPILPDRVQSVSVMAGLGVNLGYGFSVGGGVMVMAGLTGAVLVSADASGRAGSRIDTQLVATWSPVAGVQWRGRHLRVGATFRGEVEARFLVTIEARDLGINIPVLNISGVAQYDPAQLQLEAAWVADGWTVALALTGKRWSDWPGPVEATTPSSPAPPATEFTDTLVPRVALERRWAWSDGSRVALRGGYFYEPSPAPAASASRAYLDNDRHAFTAGVGFGARAAGSRFDVDVWAQLHWLAPRDAALSQGAVSHGGTVLALGSTATVTF
ncbi:MAG: hypothetical protein R3A52_11510 [Polyangiales bacterium]